MEAQQIEEKLKSQLIEQLNLAEMKPQDIITDAPLFGEGGLGLDSIDALEIIVMMEKHYGIKILNSEKVREIFYSVKTLAEYVFQNQKS
ncbi:MAG: phosphopantetheine-binding protein [Bacteroidota bacterium]